MHDKYLDVLKKHNIKYFYHFTSINNIDSILSHGICNRAYMDSVGMDYVFTDEHRYDNQKDCIGLSLDNVNKAMLRYKQNKINNDWVIIQLDAGKVISNFYDRIYYCRYNAASSAVVKMLTENKKYLKTTYAFENMFDESGKLNFQAELLLDGIIAPKYFKNIYVDSLTMKLIVQQLLENTDYKEIGVIIQKEMF
jgi:hypothetical protein